MKEVNVSCPATIANLVCGFDVLGMCVQAPCDVMNVKLLNEKKVLVQSADGYPLPSDPQQNTAGAPLVEMLEQLNENIGFDVTIYKNIKPGSGIGSSAASSAGAVVTGNYLLGNNFCNEELLWFFLFVYNVAS